MHYLSWWKLLGTNNMLVSISFDVGLNVVYLTSYITIRRGCVVVILCFKLKEIKVLSFLTLHSMFCLVDSIADMVTGTAWPVTDIMSDNVSRQHQITVTSKNFLMISLWKKVGVFQPTDWTMSMWVIVSVSHFLLIQMDLHFKGKPITCCNRKKLHCCHFLSESTVMQILCVSNTVM